jgi:hypothetical protein
MADVLIRISDLTTVCLTRPRGKEAFQKLRPIFSENDNALNLDLDSAEAPSSSFLDEMVLKLQASSLLERVTFVTRRERIRKRLSHIAGTRIVDLYFKPDPDAVRRPIPKITEEFQAEYEKKPASG